MFSRVVHRVTGGTRTVHADLTELVPFAANDMIVTSNGTAFVTQLGRAHVNLPPSELVKVRTTPVPVVRVTADGVASAATEGLLGPNGIALDESEQHVFVAEPGARRVMEYQTDGESLSGGAQFAELAPRDGRPAAGPDGICLDRDGAVWWADPLGQRVVRVTRGGQVTDEIAYEDVYPTAVALGGKDRRTLFICLVERVHRDPVAPPPRSRIDAIDVSTPGAGRP
jgi:sugar lactone lactonase YvrE